MGGRGIKNLVHHRAPMSMDEILEVLISECCMVLSRYCTCTAMPF